MNSEFDWRYYCNKYQDLRKNNINSEKKAYKHYVTYGKKENRLINLDQEKKKIYLSELKEKKDSKSNCLNNSEILENNFFNEINSVIKYEQNESINNNINSQEININSQEININSQEINKNFNKIFDYINNLSIFIEKLTNSLNKNQSINSTKNQSINSTKNQSINSIINKNDDSLLSSSDDYINQYENNSEYEDNINQYENNSEYEDNIDENNNKKLINIPTENSINLIKNSDNSLLSSDDYIHQYSDGNELNDSKDNNKE